MFDTAETYGTEADPHDNEKLVGEALKQVRGQVQLTALAACGQQGGQSSQTADQSQESQTPAGSQSPAGSEGAREPDTAGTDASQPEPAGEGRTLVVYYSATGNTRAVAEYIADATGADLFEITPAEPYTSEDLNWSNQDSRVSREYADESLRDVELASAAVDGWEEYDTVFIGYPIWWGIAAWPVNGFVEANDFTGKMVVPFCTSSSSGLGESGQLLEDLAGTGTWLEGQRFSGRVSQSDIQEWILGLEL